jgi:hypothetical protein
MKNIIKLSFSVFVIFTLFFGFNIEISRAQVSTSTIDTPCFTFDKNLYYGMESKDIDYLLKILVKEGIIKNPNNLTIKSERFDESVVTGVVAFQGKY